MKLSKNSSFVILIFEILKFRNIDRSTFRRSKFGHPLKICKLGNSENLQFGKFETFAIWKIPKICNLENSKNFFIENSKNFPNFTISKNSKSPKF